MDNIKGPKQQGSITAPEDVVVFNYGPISIMLSVFDGSRQTYQILIEDWEPAEPSALHPDLLPALRGLHSFLDDAANARRQFDS